MKIIKNAKISVKLTIIYAFMFSFILLILNASVLYGVKNYFYNEGNKQISEIKKILVKNVEHTGGGNVDIADKSLLKNMPLKENLDVKIVNANGKVLNISDEFDYKLNMKNNYNLIMHVEEKERHLAYENIAINSPKYGKIYIQIVKGMCKEYEFLKILFIFMGISDFIGIIASIILGYIFSKRMLRPIDSITKTAENIGINNLKERIDIKGPDDELKRLSSTFNNMIDRLQDAFERQNQFVSDASHELRTPIAVIKGYADLLDRWGKNDKEALLKSIKSIKIEANYMADMTEKLLFLARGDKGVQRIDKKLFHLNELIIEVVNESKLIDKNHIISVGENDNIEITADYKMIKEMLRIFIDNSIKFTKKGEKITLSSIKKNNFAVITVSDNGIGVPQEEIKNIFKRFYTVDKSRSREKAGTGLGLSIAKEICDIHNANIDIQSEEEKGTKIIITLSLSD